MDRALDQLVPFAIMFGVPFVLWWLQNQLRVARGLPPEPVGDPAVIAAGLNGLAAGDSAGHEGTHAAPPGDSTHT